MSNFYFKFDVGHSQFRDDEGIDLPDAEAARMEVLKSLAEIAKEALPKSDEQVFSASARNASGDIVYSASVTVSGAWHQ